LEFADNPLFVHGLCRLKTPVRRLGVAVHFAIHGGVRFKSSPLVKAQVTHPK